MVRDLLPPIGAFALGSGLAAALGAANLGTALAFGQIAFAGALVWVLLRGNPGRAKGRAISPEE